MKHSIETSSTPKNLEEIRRRVGEFLSQTNVSAEARSQILLAVGEAVTNSIRHSYEGRPDGRIEIDLVDEPDRIVLTLRDWGRKIDLSKVQPPELPPQKPHGLGIYFMKTIMDGIEYNAARPGGNELVLVKYKRPQGARP